MWYLPRQKVSKTERESEEWRENTVKHFTSYASFYTQDKWELMNLYSAAEGRLDPENYKYILNPYNSPKENIRQFPAQMRNIDIISPIVNLYLGEKADRPDLSTVVCVNSDSHREFQEQMNIKIPQILAQKFVNELNSMGVQTGVETQPAPDINNFLTTEKLSFIDKRAVMGQEALDYLNYDLNLKDKRQTGFRDWIITNRTYSFKYIINNDVKHEIVSPLELYHGSTPTGLIEDAPWAVRKRRLFATEILDLLNRDLSDEDVTWLESKSRYDNTAVSSTTSQVIGDSRGGNRGYHNVIESGLIDLFHLNWKCFQQYGILTYTDEFGQIQQIEVDESYVIDESKGDIEIEWLWGSLVMEAYQIEDRVIIKTVRPIPVQRNEMNNYASTKLAYNGRINLTPSVVKVLLDYQALINIYHFRGELTMARNKDKILTMPIGLLPDGWEPDKAMYFAEATGIMWFDETKPNAAQVLSAIKGIDLGLGNYIESIRNLLREVKEEAWDAVGMNRQRYGDTNSSDGKGVNEQAIFRSSTITREKFRQYEKFIESDDQGLLDNSREAWKEGKKGNYVRSDATIALLEVDGESHNENEYGVFAKDAYEEFQKLKDSKQIVSTFAQKGTVKASTLFEVLDSNNMAKIKAFARKAEAIEDQMKQKEEELNRQTQEKVAQMNNETVQRDTDTKLKIAQINSDTAIQVASIKADSAHEISSMKNETDTQPENTSENIVQKLRSEMDQETKNGLNATKEVNNVRLKEKELDLKNKELEIKKQAIKSKGKDN